MDLCGRTELSDLALLIARAELLIGIDYAPMHMAAALKIPSVVLFGPTNLNQWHPWNAPHTLLWAGDYRQLPAPVMLTPVQMNVIRMQFYHRRS
nr:glycosyltransferase family 9 protein [Morganella morganii]